MHSAKLFNLSDFDMVWQLKRLGTGRSVVINYQKDGLKGVLATTHSAESTPVTIVKGGPLKKIYICISQL